MLEMLEIESKRIEMVQDVRLIGWFWALTPRSWCCFQRVLYRHLVQPWLARELALFVHLPDGHRQDGGDVGAKRWALHLDQCQGPCTGWDRQSHDQLLLTSGKKVLTSYVALILCPVLLALFWISATCRLFWSFIIRCRQMTTRTVWVYLLIHEEKKTIKEKLFQSVLGSQFQSCFVGWLPWAAQLGAAAAFPAEFPSDFCNWTADGRRPTADGQRA